MTPKMFLHKSGTKAAASASAFLAAHRTFLETGELYPVTGPILAKLDAKELMPTPALSELRQVILNHMIASEVSKLERAHEVTERTPKNWQVTIYTSEGKVAQRFKTEDQEWVDLVAEFDQPQEADRWADRRLFEGEHDWFAVVSHATQLNKHGQLLSSTITRQDAMARVLASKPGPVIKGQAKSSGRLGWGVKSKPSVSKFSAG
jgi:hypothetical protein